MPKLKEDCAPRQIWCSASRDDLCAALQCLRDKFITYVGPFVIKSGIAAFRVSDCLLTAVELVDLYKSGQLNEEGLARLAKDVDTSHQRRLLPGRP
jgi:hypothetical protein